MWTIVLICSRVGLLLVVVMFVLPSLKTWLGIGFGATGTPRAITPRGDLAGFEKTTVVLLNPLPPYLIGEPVLTELKRDEQGAYVEAINVTGRLIFTWDTP